MEPFAKIEEGIIAVLTIDLSHDLYFPSAIKLARHPERLFQPLDAERDLNSIAVKTTGKLLPFFGPPYTAVWEGQSVSAICACQAVEELLKYSDVSQQDQTAVAGGIVRPLRIGATYGPSLFQRGVDGCVANVLGSIIKTSSELCREARKNNAFMLAADAFVNECNLEGFQQFREGVRVLEL